MTLDDVVSGHGRWEVPFEGVTDALQSQLASEHHILFHGETMAFGQFIFVDGREGNGYHDGLGLAFATASPGSLGGWNKKVLSGCLLNRYQSPVIPNRYADVLSLLK